MEEEKIIKYKAYTLYKRDDVLFETVTIDASKVYNDDNIWVNENYATSVYIKNKITREEKYILTIALVDGYYYYIEYGEIQRIRETIAHVDILKTNFKMLDEI